MDQPQTTGHDAEPTTGCSPLTALRIRAVGARLRFRRLWPEITQFGGYLESRALPVARDADLAELTLEVEGDVIRPVLADLAESPPIWPRLAKFLRGVGVERLVLSTRLESNQICDILVLLYAFRGPLRRDGSCQSTGPAAALTRVGGMSFACTQTRLADGTLSVAYSYCVTCFSRAVHWFTIRHRRFNDHRALFHAAPRYALLAVAIVAALFVLQTLVGNRWVGLVAAIVLGAALFATVYLFVMSIGSVEYDNEQKAHRLGEAYKSLKRYSDRTAEDLRRARFIQRSLLPDLERMPLPGRVDWAGSFIPESAVGGDYFDVIPLDIDRVAILFSDVSGHGLAAALMTTVLKTSFQGWADDGTDLPAFVAAVNRTLCRTMPDGSFAVLVAAVYDARSGELTYANCGHHPEPWLIPGDTDKPISSLDDARGLLLGVVEDIEILQSSRRLTPGDAVFFATDGLMEAFSPAEEMYGVDRLTRRLAVGRQLSASELVADVVGSVEEFVGDRPQEDDRTVLCMRVRALGGQT